MRFDKALVREIPRRIEIYRSRPEIETYIWKLLHFKVSMGPINLSSDARGRFDRRRISPQFSDLSHSNFVQIFNDVILQLGAIICEKLQKSWAKI